ncbi:hypothetical protein GCM10027321_25720 [Massilia terrae]|uniref:Uncharacterized protein n=1 Tax=Massilia terrae TaxID=1811224 RepID=A0ABT2CZ74_9BURK|nr:hypothetical protein [Massilia terrae]MCS0659280.1 hypothetical protein [Massilia terrae]
MTVHQVPDTMPRPRDNPPARRHHGLGERLVLSELNPDAVVDQGQDEGVPLNLITFGHVREVCPKCKQHLKLVLRQARVRIAHLLCSDCDSCFDAHYANGKPALTP